MNHVSNMGQRIRRSHNTVRGEGGGEGRGNNFDLIFAPYLRRVKHADYTSTQLWRVN